MHVKRVMILNDIYVYYGMALIRHNGQSLIDLEGMKVKLIFLELKRIMVGDGLGLTTSSLWPIPAREGCVLRHMSHALSSIIHVDAADLCLIQMLSVMVACILHTCSHRNSYLHFSLPSLSPG